MANLVKIFSKKLKAKNGDVDLDAIAANLMETTHQDDVDDEYTHKVHLSDVWKEVKQQVRWRCITLHCQETVSAGRFKPHNSSALVHSLTLRIGSLLQQSDIAEMKKLLEKIATKLGVDEDGD